MECYVAKLITEELIHLRQEQQVNLADDVLFDDEGENVGGFELHA